MLSLHDALPISERMIRNAISPRLAIKSFFISPRKLLFFRCMPRKLLLSFTLFLLLPLAGPGQTGPTEAQTRDAAVQARKTELRALMNRRTDLIRQWRRFNLEENAIFGGKSKKDLRNIAEVQQKIIQLDNTILNFGKLENYQKEKTEKRSEAPKSALKSLMRISYATFCLHKKHHT